MKIQELAIIFIIIILPISLLLSEYTQFQVQTIKMQTVYDSKLTAATYDAIKAFQLNSTNSSTSDLANSKLRDIEASVSTFRKSISSTFKLNGYTEEELNNYIPALVYTMYDGFYIYSPYENITDADGNIDNTGEKLYGLKPYINYSCRYVNEKHGIDVVITYALDNYIHVQGMVKDLHGFEIYVNRGGYLVEGITWDDSTTPPTPIYNGIRIEAEKLKETIGNREYPYVKNNGTKYYLDESNNEIIYFLNGTKLVQCTINDEEYSMWEALITHNDLGQEYYRKADEFTQWFKSTNLSKLTYADARDIAIGENDEAEIKNLWSSDDNRDIFKFQDGGTGVHIENLSSSFNQHRLEIIRHKIETNLAIAISNYNEYSGVKNVFQMPEIKEDEWDYITHNISLISFLQGLPIGGKVYNGYTIVTNSESKEVVLEENIYILSEDTSDGRKNYRRIGDRAFEKGTASVSAGKYTNSSSKENGAGRLNLDFKRAMIADNIQTYYYYPLKDYDASYNSIVMQNDVTTYDDIYEYINGQSNELKTAFYTALGRERTSKYNSNIKYETDVNKEVNMVTFNPGVEETLGEEFEIPPIVILPGDTIDIPEEEPTKPGHTFEGWVPSDDPNREPLGPGDPFTPGGDVELEAVYTKNKYTISYNANGGYGAPESHIDVEYETDITIREEKPVRTGYNFLWWESQTGQTYLPKGKYTVKGADTLRAEWEAKKYTVKFDDNVEGEEIAVPGEQTKTHDIELKLTDTKPYRNGYEFLGWATTATATNVEYKPGDIYTLEGDRTLYALWKSLTYTLTYDANGGNGAPISQTWQEGNQLKLSSTIPTKDGYTFIGWSLNKNAAQPDYYAGQVLNNQTGDKTLYAVWKLNEYTITFNPNGGSGGPGTQTKTHGVSMKISSTQPTRTGYTFQGWATSSSATTAQYSANGTYTGNGNATLYAVWKINTYTIKYNANGGSGAPGNQTKTYGKALTLSTTRPTRDGYDFLGWGTSSTTTTVSYQPGATYTSNTGRTLYAIWNPHTYTISFNANGGSGGPGTQIKTHGISMKISSTKPTKTGYTFQGWATSSSATTAQYSAGGYYSTEGNATLYAVWKIDTYTISYSANGGSGAPGEQTKTYNVKLTLSSTKPTRTGFTFQGWATSASATSAQYQPGASYTSNSGATLYAVWKINEYTVDYNANGGSGAPSSQIKTHGTSLTLSSTKPTRTGYTFKGWSTSSTSTGVNYQPGGKYTSNSSTTLYAVWSANTYTISYNANGGSGAPESQTMTYGSSTTLSSTKPTRTGYTFLGWSTNSTATASSYYPGQVVTNLSDSNVTLYAVWEINKYTILYNANGGSGAPNAQTKTYNVNIVLSTTKPTKTGHTFQGWAISSSATSVQYQPGETYSANANLSLYAVWEPDAYTITYSANGGDGEPSPQTRIYGNNLTLSITQPTRTGYTFLGWSTNSSATASSYYPGQVVTNLPNSNVTLYAVWKINTYTVTYNANGGSGAPSAQTKTYNVNIKLSSTKPTREGYTFQGWATLSSATSAEYQSGVNYTLNANITLYAVWKSYTDPYLPPGYKYVEGTSLDTGLVIENISTKDQFVWIEVPKTTDVYLTVGPDIAGYTFWEYEDEIEKDLHTYTNYYRNGTEFADEWEWYTEKATGLDSQEYGDLKYKMLKSVYTYGGFYIGRYETGTTTARIGVTEAIQKPLIQANVYPYEYVTTKQAQTLASGFASSLSGYDTSLLFGVQWDLVLKYLETKAVKKGISLQTIQSQLNTNSTSWGNYSNSVYTITNANASYKYMLEWKNGKYNKPTSTSSVQLLSTGADTKFSMQNIYDFAGNKSEWTLEYSYDSISPCVARGGAYWHDGNHAPASWRGQFQAPTGTYLFNGYERCFRVTLYKDADI